MIAKRTEWIEGIAAAKEKQRAGLEAMRADYDKSIVDDYTSDATLANLEQSSAALLDDTIVSPDDLILTDLPAFPLALYQALRELGNKKEAYFHYAYWRALKEGKLPGVHTAPEVATKLGIEVKQARKYLESEWLAIKVADRKMTNGRPAALYALDNWKSILPRLQYRLPFAFARAEYHDDDKTLRPSVEYAPEALQPSDSNLRAFSSLADWQALERENPHSDDIDKKQRVAEWRYKMLEARLLKIGGATLNIPYADYADASELEGAALRAVMYGYQEPSMFYDWEIKTLTGIRNVGAAAKAANIGRAIPDIDVIIQRKVAPGDNLDYHSSSARREALDNINKYAEEHGLNSIKHKTTYVSRTRVKEHDDGSTTYAFKAVSPKLYVLLELKGKDVPIKDTTDTKDKTAPKSDDSAKDETAPKSEIAELPRIERHDGIAPSEDEKLLAFAVFMQAAGKVRIKRRKVYTLDGIQLNATVESLLDYYEHGIVSTIGNIIIEHDGKRIPF